MMVTRIGRSAARRLLPNWLVYALRARRLGVDMLGGGVGLSARETRRLFGRLQRVAAHVPCGHGEPEILTVVRAILGTPAAVPGVVVEAGCWKGGSTCKFSLATALAGRRLVVFDSFQGIPSNEEGYVRNIHGVVVSFAEGDYAASQEEVQRNVDRYGEPSVMTLVPGWLEETLPAFREPVAVAYLDVDLASSTLTCLRYLWPLLQPGGVIYSQDGHLTNVLEAMTDDSWWAEHLGSPAPRVYGAGTQKLVYLTKQQTKATRAPAASQSGSSL